jgi:hypothetical protein
MVPILIRYLKLWNPHSPRKMITSLKFSKISVVPQDQVKSGSSEHYNPEVPDFNGYISVGPVTYPFLSHSLFQNTNRHYTV